MDTLKKLSDLLTDHTQLFHYLHGILNIVYTSDLLETILSHLSAKVMESIANGNYVQHLGYLLTFLATWKKHPPSLTPITYQWCSAFSEAITGLEQSGIYVRQALLAQPLSEEGFTEVGPGCN